MQDKTPCSPFSNMPGPLPVRHLACLPVELIHHIFNDLSVLQILCIAIHDVAHLDNCILSHKHYGRLFSSSVRLAKAKSYFMLYSDVIAHLSHRKSFAYVPSADCLQLNPSTWKAAPSISHLVAELHRAIAYALSNVAQRTPLPTEFTSPANTDSPISLLLARWSALRDAQCALCSIKASQLMRLADLTETHAHMLKWSTDPSQGCRRNSARIVAQLRRKAQNIVRNRIVGQTWSFSHLAYPIPIVPYDRFLRLFLKVVERFPPPGIIRPNRQGEGTQKQPCDYPYPAAVAQDIATAIAGLAYVHTKSFPPSCKDPPPIIIRTMYTPYSVGEYWSEHDDQHAIFMFPSREISPHNHRRGVVPLSEKEIEWLVAFVNSCTFLSSMDAEWVPGQTVAQMWKREEG